MCSFAQETNIQYSYSSTSTRRPECSHVSLLVLGTSRTRLPTYRASGSLILVRSLRCQFRCCHQQSEETTLPEVVVLLSLCPINDHTHHHVAVSSSKTTMDATHRASSSRSNKKNIRHSAPYLRCGRWLSRRNSAIHEGRIVGRTFQGPRGMGNRRVRYDGSDRRHDGARHFPQTRYFHPDLGP